MLRLRSVADSPKISSSLSGGRVSGHGGGGGGGSAPMSMHTRGHEDSCGDEAGAARVAKEQERQVKEAQAEAARLNNAEQERQVNEAQAEAVEGWSSGMLRSVGTSIFLSRARGVSGYAGAFRFFRPLQVRCLACRRSVLCFLASC